MTRPTGPKLKQRDDLLTILERGQHRLRSVRPPESDRRSIGTFRGMAFALVPSLALWALLMWLVWHAGISLLTVLQ